jgi:hypothetical protein
MNKFIVKTIIKYGLLLLAARFVIALGLSVLITKFKGVNQQYLWAFYIVIVVLLTFTVMASTIVHYRINNKIYYYHRQYEILICTAISLISGFLYILPYNLLLTTLSIILAGILPFMMIRTLKFYTNEPGDDFHDNEFFHWNRKK